MTDSPGAADSKGDTRDDRKQYIQTASASAGEVEDSHVGEPITMVSAVKTP